MSEINTNYHEIITGLKEKIRQARLRAAVLANTELLKIYWEIGLTILSYQQHEGWGAKTIERLAADLKAEFPDFKGFSIRNLKYMRAFAAAWPEFEIRQGLLAQLKQAKYQHDTIVQASLAQLPWYHHITLLDKIKEREKRLFYIQKAIENGWSRDVMVHQIETGLFERSGKAITNFKETLPAPQSDLAQQAIKNPYVFDFLGFSENMKERDLERALVSHLKDFMLELGKGFAWLGNQKQLVIDGKEFFLDLLFFNCNMNCFVNFELKIGEFKAEFAGKLNFYVNTIDAQLKRPEHNPTIGILLCKTPNETIIKYSLQGIESPIGVSSYQLEKALPANLTANSLPTVEELEKEIEHTYEEFKSPTEKKIDHLKSLLKNLNEPELQEKMNAEACRAIFDRILMVLLVKMENKLSLEVSSMFRENETRILIDGHAFHTYEDAAPFLDDRKNMYTKAGIEIVNHGFKKAGRKAFNCWSGLQINLETYKFTFTLLNQKNILLEKLYHDKISNAEEEELIETWLNALLDDITLKVQHINQESR
jgi:predicted nuclease of restriction endonuclease-like (RecB) superfamily